MPYELVRLPNGQQVLVPVGRSHPPPAVRNTSLPLGYDDYMPEYRPPRRRRRGGRHISGPAKAMAIFLGGWLWCGVGLPGMTLATWFFGVCWLMNRAFRER